MGRGVPDIAAQAINLLIVNHRGYFAVDGTSYAAPVRLCLLPPLCVVHPSSTQLIINVQTVTGIISLLNDYRLSQGEKPLGFLNPWLYGQGIAGLNDITSGSNPGCQTEGFSAVIGWDPVRHKSYASLH